eukprot:4138624-Lingulodinium_polyedra.AAC.1
MGPNFLNEVHVQTIGDGPPTHDLNEPLEDEINQDALQEADEHIAQRGRFGSQSHLGHQHLEIVR